MWLEQSLPQVIYRVPSNVTIALLSLDHTLANVGSCGPCFKQGSSKCWNSRWAHRGQLALIAGGAKPEALDSIRLFGLDSGLLSS